MRVSLILVTLGILATVVSGAIFIKKAKKVSKSGMRKAVITNVLAVAGLFLIGLVPDIAFADSAANTATNSASGLGYLAAALSTGLAAIGAGHTLRLARSGVVPVPRRLGRR